MDPITSSTTFGETSHLCSKKYTFCLGFCFMFFNLLTAQAPTKYNLFSRVPLSQINLTSPKMSSFEPVNSNTVREPNVNPIFIPVAGNSQLVGESVERQNQLILQQHNGMLISQTEHDLPDDVKADLREVEVNSHYNDWLEKSKFYRNAYAELSKMNPTNFSITKAVYIVENAWQENKFTFKEFERRMDVEEKIIKQQLKSEKLSGDNNMALNYAIQKRFKQGGSYYDVNKKQTVIARPFKYDFIDYMGATDYRQMFVTKMLITGKGQCHSMPLMYLMIAEKVGAQAWLSLAPEHSFIQFMDPKGHLINFETTNGALVSTSWLQQSGYINAAALKNRVYLDTLSKKELYAQCLGDLLQGYLQKFNYDEFAEMLRQQILQLNPKSMTAVMIEAKVKTIIARQEIEAAGRPPEQELHSFPRAYQAYLSMQAAYEKVDGMGFQEMPPAAYQRWLKSVEREQQKQANKEIQNRVKIEINSMRKRETKSTVVGRTKQ